VRVENNWELKQIKVETTNTKHQGDKKYHHEFKMDFETIQSQEIWKMV
jgi:hypothetical protein